MTEQYNGNIRLNYYIASIYKYMVDVSAQKCMYTHQF